MLFRDKKNCYFLSNVQSGEPVKITNKSNFEIGCLNNFTLNIEIVVILFIIIILKLLKY